MKVHTWGTFSVRDHVKARAFVAEAVLFDKLVVPTPPPEDSSAFSNWDRNEWYPARQRELLNILGEYDLVLELPWGRQAEEHYSMLMAAPNADQVGASSNALTESILQQLEDAKRQSPKDAPYFATPGVLSLYVAGALQNQVASKLAAKAREPGVPVEAVIAYDSYSEFEREQIVHPGREGSQAQYALFTWEFFVPNDSEKRDEDLLRIAAKFGSQPEVREARQEYHGWLKQIYAQNVDPNDAVPQMLKMLDKYKQMMRGSGFRTAALRVSKAVSLLTPVLMTAAPALGLATPHAMTLPVDVASQFDNCRTGMVCSKIRGSGQCEACRVNI